MYNVHAMKRYTVSQVRERFAEALDHADKGVPVVIERKGVRYSLQVEPTPAPSRKRKSIITYMDPAVAAGQWSWEMGPDGLEFRDRRPKK
jgi:antitoxin (DNA-binding transcriptional repressor) of toxin-antitoxin stability system